MIGLDTNVLVRYLTQDDAAQSQQATELLERHLSEANLGFISLVAMVELVWVLDRAYRMAARQIAVAIERLLQTEVFVIEKEQEVFAAMIVLRQGGGSFADALIAELGLQAGCSYTLTFDIKAARLPGFKLV